MAVNLKRVKKLNSHNIKPGPVVYWMSRDQRINDNWAALYAQELAFELKQPLIVIFSLVTNFLEATIRQYSFMLEGLKQLETSLKAKNIPFFLILGNPEDQIVKFVDKIRAGCLINDFDPLKIKRKWKNSISKSISIPFFEVDAHNIVPCIIASPKQEFAAYTIRPKIKKLLTEFFEDVPQIKSHPFKFNSDRPDINWDDNYKSLKINKEVQPLTWIRPGEEQAAKSLKNFIENKLDNYKILKNDPSRDGLSNLSPYLHFGQISAHRIALEAQKSNKNIESKESFLEELIIRKELSDNFCFYNSNYDNFDGFPSWAKQTLEEHSSDNREYIYNLEEFENAKTHDILWNAAQLEMVKKGKMHGYMRMYWAKKILEWTHCVDEALKIAIYLNDKYEIDGRDPNGYTGISWSIGGTHDRAWPQRKVFGKVRYMSYQSTKRKFNSLEYINKVNML